MARRSHSWWKSRSVVLIVNPIDNQRVHLLPPHHANFSKRLIKTPKLYFHDSGLAAWLLGIQSSDQIATHAMRGPLFESWVIAELLKSRYNEARTSDLYFWRDRKGLEVDVLIDRGDSLVPVEIKAGQTVASDFFSGLSRWLALAGSRAGKPWLVYGGDQCHTRRGTEVVPWSEIHELTGA